MDGPKTTGIIYYTPHYELKSIDGMTKSAIHVLSCIVASITMRNGQWPFCFASYSVLGASTGYSISSVAKAVSVLKKLGLVIVQKIDGGVNAIYPTENVRKCLSFFPANARLSCTFREHELLYGQRHGRPYRPNAERNERLRREHAMAIEEGARLLDNNLNAGAKVQNIGESPVLQGNAAAMQAEPFQAFQENAMALENAQGERSRKPGEERQRICRRNAEKVRHGSVVRHPSYSMENSEADSAVRDALEKAQKMFKSGIHDNLSASRFGFIYALQRHKGWLEMLPRLYDRIEPPSCAEEVIEWSKIESCRGCRADRCMDLDEAEEFIAYNEKRGWSRHWYLNIKIFLGRKCNSGCLDILDRIRRDTTYPWSNYSYEVALKCRDALVAGGSVKDFLAQYLNEGYAIA